jgi:Family of unknown function (DUF6152)
MDNRQTYSETGGNAMRKRLFTVAAVVSGLLIVSFPLVAHHGNAEFNTDKTVTVKGAVTEWVWANPHCFLKFDEKTTDGEVRHWVVETSNPPGMINLGWNKYSFRPGDEVSVTMHQVKDVKRPIGRAVRVVLPNGKVLDTGRDDVTTGTAGGSGSESYSK